jgi:hypothetical protein
VSFCLSRILGSGLIVGRFVGFSSEEELPGGLVPPGFENGIYTAFYIGQNSPTYPPLLDTYAGPSPQPTCNGVTCDQHHNAIRGSLSEFQTNQFQLPNHRFNSGQQPPETVVYDK